MFVTMWLIQQQAKRLFLQASKCSAALCRRGMVIEFVCSTLFIGGIGKFFEGDARDMYRILFHVLTKLPDETWVYCGHEYTKTNLKVRLTVCVFAVYQMLIICNHSLR